MNDRPTLLRVHAGAMVLLAVVWGAAMTGCTPEQVGGGAAPGPGPTRAPGGRKFSLFKPSEPEPRPPDHRTVWPPRAVWVVREEYRSPAEITSLMESIRQAGLNTVLFQVRGNATAYYRSSIEPSAYASDPGFDPLEIACREAHRRGLAIHAWVNVMPAWKGPTPPTDPRQLWNAHPDWLWYDQNGRRQPLGDYYVSVNPCRPEVRQYLVGVFREILQRYPVDGLHLDYIRFPNDKSPRGSDYPYDARTLALYRQVTGKRPQDGKASWSQWRTQQVTQLVREIRQMTRSVGRPVRLTASCGADLARWRTDHFQDGPAWLKGKLVDLVFVMNYQTSTRIFEQRQQEWFNAAPGCWAAPGLGVYEHRTAAVTIDQLKLAQRWGHGFGLFSAGSLFSAAGRQRLEAIKPVLLSMQNRSTARLDVPPDGLASAR